MVSPHEVADHVAVPVLLQLSEEASAAGNYQAGAIYAQRAAEGAEERGEELLLASALRVFAKQQLRLGDLEAAARCAERSAAILEAHGDEAGACESHTVEAFAYTELGLLDEALATLEACFSTAQRLQDAALMCWAANRIGIVHDDLQNHDQAKQFLHHSYGLARTAGLGLDDEFCALNNLASNAVSYVTHLRDLSETTRAEAELAEGLRYAAEAVALARTGTNPYRVSISLENYAALVGLSDGFDEAFVLLDRVLGICEKNGYRLVGFGARKEIAELWLRRGDVAEAVKRLTKLLDAVNDIGEPQLVSDVHRLLSIAYERSHDFESALRHSREQHRCDQALQAQQAGTRARILTHHFEIHNARLEAERARLETDLERIRSTELEAEKELLRRRTIELGRHAQEDQLTGLWNRRHMDHELPRILSAAKLSRRPVCVAVSDLDFFKYVNDVFGHPIGDIVLKHVAAILRSGCRPGDMLARIGGEEFVLALVDVELAAGRSTCERLRAAVEAYDWESIQLGLRVTISFGIAQLGVDSDSATLFRCADNRLYHAKRTGRNRVEPPHDYLMGTNQR